MRHIFVAIGLILYVSSSSCASAASGGATGGPAMQQVTFDQQDPLYRMMIERSREQFLAAGAEVTPEGWNLLEARIRRATLMLRQAGAPNAQVARAQEDIATFVQWMIDHENAQPNDRPIVSEESFYAALSKCNPNNPKYPGCP